VPAALDEATTSRSEVMSCTIESVPVLSWDFNDIN
jgi:hypothetical protein